MHLVGVTTSAETYQVGVTKSAETNQVGVTTSAETNQVGVATSAETNQLITAWLRKPTTCRKTSRQNNPLFSSTTTKAQ